MRISGFSWFAPAALPRMTPTDALLADQSHSIPDNLVALLSHSRAWNCSAETAPAARQSSGERLHSNAKRTRPYAFYPSLHDPKAQVSARIAEWLLRDGLPTFADPVVNGQIAPKPALRLPRIER